MFLQDISLVSPEKTELSRIISRKNVLARYLISLSRENKSLGRMFLQDCLSIENSYYLSEECSCKISHYISLQRKQNCLVLSLGRMFLQDISLASPEKTELSRIISRKNVLARYLISLSREKELSRIMSRKNVLARYLISLSISRIMSRKNVLARYLIRENRIVSYYLSEEMSH
ncbi:unnamed protein product [Acanthosepion pharaonis]|uniref:Uncharacterized protein n=1 Tax=Acanthosepion pharaonis TaxID=158019 RepID=A0A812BLE3_ACAPH|nr:unnamed protein product [Sepia pharaonis]